MKYSNYEYKNNVLHNNHGDIISEEECWNGIPQCRITSEDMFKDKVTRELRYIFPEYSDKLFGNSEIVFQYGRNFKKYRDKKILIVGGGPTTNQCQWENLDVDYIWSCNHFFKHPKLKKYPVDLAFIGQEVQIYSEDFIEYVSKHNTKVGFELAGKWVHHGTGVGWTIVPNYDIKNHFCFFTRYYGWIGANWRQIILALFLGVKEIYFVGMDGYSFKTNPKDIPHSFEPGKEPKGGPMKPGAEEAFKQHLIIFWNYVLNRLKSDVKFHNLGEFSEDNMTAEISKKHFPLSDEIKKTIGVKY
tara:strand:- start:10787 stop:11689 length:903 start_codon:yes stop_codon:yes gene_type:complete